MEHCPLLQRRVLTPGSAKHLLFELSLHAGSLLQVVKAFIVLNSEFSCRDPDELTKELQQHVKSVTAPYKYPRKVSESSWMGSGPFERFWGFHCLSLIGCSVAGVKHKHPRELKVLPTEEAFQFMHVGEPT